MPNPLDPPILPVGFNFDEGECDRLNCHFTMVHEHCGAPPTEVQVKFADRLKETAKAYQREMKLKTDWVQIPIDFTWMESFGYLIIENHVGVRRFKTPTEEELKFEKEQIIWISADGDNPRDEWKVPPGGLFVGYPGQHKYIYLKASQGVIPVLFTVFPE